MKIYTVTAVSLSGENLEKRCFGFFESYDSAKNHVKSNFKDYLENYYNHIVIEEFESGFHAVRITEKWFGFDGDKMVEIIKPSVVLGVINFAIG